MNWQDDHYVNYYQSRYKSEGTLMMELEFGHTMNFDITSPYPKVRGVEIAGRHRKCKDCCFRVGEEVAGTNLIDKVLTNISEAIKILTSKKRSDK